MLSLNDFFDISKPQKTKIKFNMNAGNVELRAWDLLLDDSDSWLEMNEWRTRHANNNMSDAEYLLSFAQYYPYGPNYFIFGGFYKIEEKKPCIVNGRGYKLTKVDKYSDLEKRLIIKLKQPIGQNLYLRWYENIENLGLEIYELSPSTKLGSFPGYNWVSLKHKDLVNIVNNEEASWKNALSNIKAIYAITDLCSGKIYIGSATGNTDGLWQRWLSYAIGYTGGNEAFKDIFNDSLGEDYIKNNFQYSIVEIFDTKTKQDVIIQRESYWKRVFDTRKHGMNYN